MRIASAASLLLIASAASAQIQLPDTVSPYEPIVAVCECQAPEGAEIQTRWSLTSAGNASASQIAVTSRRLHLWGSPGRHRLTSTVVWLLFEEVEVVTPSGGTKKIKSLVKWDTKSYVKNFTISGTPPGPGPDPDPDPPEPPVPPGRRWLVILEETEDRTPQEADLWVDLRQLDLGQHELYITDHDVQSEWLPPYEQARKDKGQGLPCMFVVDPATEQLVWLGDAPKSVAEFQKIVKDNS